MADFNSKEYGWKDMKVNIAGQEISGIEEIRYVAKRETEERYGAGDEPQDIERKNKSYSGEIMITQNELEKLRLKVAGGHISDFDLIITVSYSKTAIGRQTTDQLLGVVLEEEALGMAQGDGHSQVRIPFKFLRLLKGI
jgi:hypothetical protein